MSNDRAKTTRDHLATWWHVSTHICSNLITDTRPKESKAMRLKRIAARKEAAYSKADAFMAERSNTPTVRKDQAYRTFLDYYSD